MLLLVLLLSMVMVIISVSISVKCVDGVEFAVGGSVAPVIVAAVIVGDPDCF